MATLALNTHNGRISDATVDGNVFIDKLLLHLMNMLQGSVLDIRLCVRGKVAPEHAFISTLYVLNTLARYNALGTSMSGSIHSDQQALAGAEHAFAKNALLVEERNIYHVIQVYFSCTCMYFNITIHHLMQRIMKQPKAKLHYEMPYRVTHIYNAHCPAINARAALNYVLGM